jgi:tetratricopeptide (TPR) repeat protein
MTYAEKALAIDETLGEAHTSLGDAKLLFDLDWRGSEAEFRRGLELSPNYANAHHWYAELLLDWGRFDESIRESYVARELDPMSAMMNSALASRLCAAHRCSDGVGDAMLAVELDPNLPLAHSILAELYLAQGQAEKSIVETQKAVRFSGGNPNFLAELAYVYAVSGDRENARKILSSLSAKSKTGYVAPYQLAAAYTALGDKRHALAKLYEAYEEHSPWLDNLYLDSLEGGRLIDLRTEPRFVELLRRIGPPRS